MPKRCATGSEAVSGLFRGVSGIVRAVGWPRIDDLGFPRGLRVGWKPGRVGERRRRHGVTGRLFALAVGEAGDKEAEELAGTVRPTSSQAARGEGFDGGCEAGLSHC